jgi:hypothetical protein
MQDRNDIAHHLMATMSAEEQAHYLDIIRKAEEKKLERARRNDPDDTTEPGEEG